MTRQWFSITCVNARLDRMVTDARVPGRTTRTDDLHLPDAQTVRLADAPRIGKEDWAHHSCACRSFTLREGLCPGLDGWQRARPDGRGNVGQTTVRAGSSRARASQRPPRTQALCRFPVNW